MATHRDRLNVYDLGHNPHFPWDQYLDSLADQVDEWQWSQLLKNPALTIDRDFIERYREHLEWETVSRRRH